MRRNGRNAVSGDGVRGGGGGTAADACGREQSERRGKRKGEALRAVCRGERARWWGDQGAIWPASLACGRHAADATCRGRDSAAGGRRRRPRGVGRRPGRFGQRAEREAAAR
jgi:hypothetical protein